ncbi:MAG: hypothetical protein ACYCYP_07840 [Leptospirales bacterium]
MPSRFKMLGIAGEGFLIGPEEWKGWYPLPQSQEGYRTFSRRRREGVVPGEALSALPGHDRVGIGMDALLC